MNTFAQTHSYCSMGEHFWQLSIKYERCNVAILLSAKRNVRGQQPTIKLPLDEKHTLTFFLCSNFWLPCKVSFWYWCVCTFCLLHLPNINNIYIEKLWHQNRHYMLWLSCRSSCSLHKLKFVQVYSINKIKWKETFNLHSCIKTFIYYYY